MINKTVLYVQILFEDTVPDYLANMGTVQTWANKEIMYNKHLHPQYFSNMCTFYWALIGIIHLDTFHKNVVYM